MNSLKNNFFIPGILLISILFASCKQTGQADLWAIKDFVKVDEANPILKADSTSKFACPMLHGSVAWEAKDVFNPAAVVKDNKVFLLYRAEDFVGKHNGTSRIGLAISEDGINFKKHPYPVLYPEDDFLKKYEWDGGIEDPRVVETEQGTYVMTYTSYDGTTARLCIAISKDLYKWKKTGPAFKGLVDMSQINVKRNKDGSLTRESVNLQRETGRWSKSGSIVCKKEGNKFKAVKIKEKYWMYWGDTDIFLATSDDLTNWEPITDEAGKIIPVLKRRKGYFDSNLVEPGPPAFITNDGILLIYNSRNSATDGDKTITAKAYCAGQALFNRNNPAVLIDRLNENFMKPDKNYETEGQVNQVCFLEGLVYYKNKYFVYYGTADSKIAVAIHNDKK